MFQLWGFAGLTARSPDGSGVMNLPELGVI